jgi:hypothetical protein
MPKCRPIPKALTIAETEMSADTDTEISAETDTEILAETDTETDNFRSLIIIIQGILTDNKVIFGIISTQLLIAQGILQNTEARKNNWYCYAVSFGIWSAGGYNNVEIDVSE